MARSRRNGNPWRNAGIRSTIRNGIESNQSRDSVLNAVRDKYPDVRMSEFNTVYNDESRSRNSINDLMEANRGRFANVADVLGCTEGTATHVTVTINTRRKGTSSTKNITVGVNVSAGNRVGDFLKDVLSAAVDEIRSFGAEHYNIPNLNRLYDNLGGIVTIDHIRCT